MFSITATKSSTGVGGVGTIVAKGHGRQKTTRYDHAYSVEKNFGAAVGALLNLLTTPEEQAKVRHPSGGQRVRVQSLSDAGGKYRFTVNV